MALTSSPSIHGHCSEKPIFVLIAGVGTLKHTTGKCFVKTLIYGTEISFTLIQCFHPANAFLLRGIFTAGTETLHRQRVMEKYSSASRATASFLLLSLLGHSNSKTMKDKAVSTRSVPQLCLSFILCRSLGQTLDHSDCL